MNEATNIDLALCRLLEYMPLMQGGTNSPLCLLVSLYVLFTSCCHLSDTLFRLFVVLHTESGNTELISLRNYGCEPVFQKVPRASFQNIMYRHEDQKVTSMTSVGFHPFIQRFL